MRTSVSAKRCPECGKVAALRARECPECGHEFRTRFAEPADRTEAFDASLLARSPAGSGRSGRQRGRRAPSSFAAAFLGAFCLAAAIGLGAWLAGGFHPEFHSRPVPARPRSVSSAGIPRSGQAEALYERLAPLMSLHDVDRAAGGLGRVARSPSPHVMLLSYDYPQQSVRVLLYRRAPAGEFRVRSVALYHGNLLLRLRKAGH